MSEDVIITWVSVDERLPLFGEEVLLIVGWPDDDRRRVAFGERCTSGPGDSYWWVYGSLGGQRAEREHIGDSVAMARKHYVQDSADTRRAGVAAVSAVVQAAKAA